MDTEFEWDFDAWIGKERQMRLTTTCTLVACVVLSVAVITLGWAGDAKPRLANPLFAFDNGTGRDSQVPFSKQAKMLKQLGYAGIGFTGTARIQEMLKALDAHGLKMFSIYVSANIAADRPAYDKAGLSKAIEQLNGGDTLIWLCVEGAVPTSDEADDRAVAIIREIGDMAEKSGLRVALYHHVRHYVDQVEDAVRLVKQVDRKNVGASFNLCHFLKLDDEKYLQQRLEESMPHLFVVSINGADSGETKSMDWDRLIQRLDQGSFDMKGLLQTLDELGYTGPIGLQSYNVAGDVPDNLRSSIEAWRKLSVQ